MLLLQTIHSIDVLLLCILLAHASLLMPCILGRERNTNHRRCIHNPFIRLLSMQATECNVTKAHCAHILHALSGSRSQGGFCSVLHHQRWLACTTHTAAASPRLQLTQAVALLDLRLSQSLFSRRTPIPTSVKIYVNDVHLGRRAERPRSRLKQCQDCNIPCTPILHYIRMGYRRRDGCPVEEEAATRFTLKQAHLVLSLRF